MCRIVMLCMMPFQGADAEGYPRRIFLKNENGEEEVIDGELMSLISSDS